MNRVLLCGCLGGLLLAACGPTILEKRIIEQPDPALLRPGPSAEEQSGEAPMLEDIRPALTLVPADHDAPKPPDDPRPLALRDAPQTAPPMPPPPGDGAPAAAAPSDDERRDDRRDDAGEDDAREDDSGEDDGPRRGGMRINPR